MTSATRDTHVWESETHMWELEACMWEPETHVWELETGVWEPLGSGPPILLWEMRPQ